MAVSNNMRQFFDAFIDDFEKSKKTGVQDYSNSNKHFTYAVTEKSSKFVFEDHQNKMTQKELASHIRMLFKKCEDEETEKKFLKTLADNLDDVDKATSKDLKDCAKKLVDMDEDKADKVIHKLEKLVDYEYEDDKDSKKDDDDDKDKKEDKEEDED